MRSYFVILLVGLLPLYGCTSTADTDATTGAVTGGVIGAGLGAIIGSATGDAGAGLAIGAAAGTATGAVIGNKMATQNEAIRTQDEALERQDRIIAANKSQIEELKRLSGDNNVAFRGKAAPVGVDAALVARRNRAFITPVQPRQPVPAREVASHNSAITEKVIATYPQGKVEFDSSHTAATHEAVNETGLLEIKKEEPVTVRGTYDWEDSNKNVEKNVAVEKTAAPIAAGTLDAEVEDHNADTAKVVDELTSETEKTVISGVSAECKQAEEEVTQAKISAEASDKLFHYRRALRLCPDSAAHHNGLGEVYMSLGRKVDAEFEFQQALKVEPGFSPAEENLTKIR